MHIQFKISSSNHFKQQVAKFQREKKIVFISIVINRTKLNIKSKLSEEDANRTSSYTENDTLAQQPVVTCQTDKILPGLRIRQRDYSKETTDPENRSLDNTQQKKSNLEKLFDQQSHSLQCLRSAVKLLAKTVKPKHSKRRKKQ